MNFPKVSWNFGKIFDMVIPKILFNFAVRDNMTI